MSTPRSVVLPEGVRRRHVATSRGTFAVLEAGPGDRAGRALALLVPGWTGSKEDFLALLGPLSAIGVTVVTADQRGQYETPGPPDPGSYALEEFGADISALARAIDDRPVHLVGHSFGGLTARAATLAAPDRFQSLTLLCSGPSGFSGTKAAKLRFLATVLPAAGVRRTYGLKRGFERARDRLRNLPALAPEVEEFLRARFVANAPASLLAITRHLVDAPDLVDELTAVPVPKLVMTGTCDDGWPIVDQRRMAERLRAPHVLIPGAGHSPAVDRPDDTADGLLRFWDEIEGRSSTPHRHAPTP